MKIGIDVSMLVYRGSGVATYTYNLVKYLCLYDKKNEYRLFYSSLRRPKNFYYLDELKKLGVKIYDYRLPPSFLKFFWNKFHLFPVEWFIGKVDFYHSSDFLRPPLLKGTKGITTIHDLTWKIYPDYHTEDIVSSHERKLEKTIKYGDIIIVDSQNTKKDLLKYYPNIFKTNRLEVIYPGIDERFRPIKNQTKIKKVLKKYGINYPKKYLLYVGSIEPRKNLTTAINVFHQFITPKQRQKPSRFNKIKKDRTSKVNEMNPYSDFEFLIVGRAGWKNEEVFQLVKRLNIENKVKFVGFVEDEDLPFFYNASEVLIFLSKYEGFGFPPLEALACGTKVLAGKNSSLKEILSEKYLVDLSDEEKILKKLKSVLQDKKPINFDRKKIPWRRYVKSFLSLIRNK